MQFPRHNRTVHQQGRERPQYQRAKSADTSCRIRASVTKPHKPHETASRNTPQRSLSPRVHDAAERNRQTACKLQLNTVRLPALIAVLIYSVTGAAASVETTARINRHTDLDRLAFKLANSDTMRLPFPPQPDLATPAHSQAGPSAPAPVSSPPNSSIQPTPERTSRTERSSILIPFDSSVGAAAFKQRDQLVVVFDTERPIDLSPLRADPVYGKATINMLPGAIVMRLPLPDGIWASLEQEPDGWRIVLQAELQAYRPPP